MSVGFGSCAGSYAGIWMAINKYSKRHLMHMAEEVMRDEIRSNLLATQLYARIASKTGLPISEVRRKVHELALLGETL